MKLKKVSFEISKKAYITKEERDFLIEAYRKMYIKIYGFDFLDAFLCVTKADSSKFFNERKELKNLGENQNRALQAMDTLENNENFELLVIRDEKDNLIGGGRLKKINEKEASIPDIVIECDNVKVSRDIWCQAIKFAEEYFVSCGYEKMYIEIALKDGPLLGRANKLGFFEDPNDIRIDGTVKTYLLNKILERKYNEKFDNSSE